MDDEDQQTVTTATPAPQQTTGWDGMTATNPRTGERLVYRVNPTGHGRWVALNSTNAPAPDRQRVTDLTTRAQIGQRTLSQARSFIDLNATHGTGGLTNDPHFPSFLNTWIDPAAQRFENLSNQMVGSNWQPGTSGMMNTATEQQMMRGRYPAPTNAGPVNQDIYLRMAEDVGVQQAAVNDMRQWLTRHTTLDGWDEHWAQREAELRPRLRQQVVQQFNADRTNARSGSQSNAGAPPQGVSQSEWDHMTPQERSLWRTR